MDIFMSMKINIAREIFMHMILREGVPPPPVLRNFSFFPGHRFTDQENALCPNLTNQDPIRLSANILFPQFENSGNCDVSLSTLTLSDSVRFTYNCTQPTKYLRFRPCWSLTIHYYQLLSLLVFFKRLPNINLRVTYRAYAWLVYNPSEFVRNSKAQRDKYCVTPITRSSLASHERSGGASSKVVQPWSRL